MFFDIGVGILISIFASWFFDVPITAPLLVFGITSALLPDIDMTWFGVKRLFGSKAQDHRSFTHYPLFYIPLVAVVYYIFGGMYATVLALGVYIHLIHDTVGLGWGIAWLWPFSYYKHQLLPVKGGDGRWIRNYYLRPNKIAYIEYGTLLASLASLYFYAS